MSNHLPVPLMSRGFFSTYAHMIEEQNPGWLSWCGYGPLDNDASICHLTPSRDPLAPRKDPDEAERKEFEQAFSGLDFSIRRKHGIYVYEKRRVEDYWQGWKLCARISKNRKDPAERLGLTK